jgi:hypothetical protein
MSKATAQNVTVDLDNLEAKKKELQDLLRAQKTLAKQKEWEDKTKARNPAYVVGSLRPATEADQEVLTHCHGWVCEIKCQHPGCDQVRVINKQDAFQVQFCKEHKAEARKASAKARRESKKLEDMTPESVQAEIAKLQEQLGKLQG